MNVRCAAKKKAATAEEVPKAKETEKETNPRIKNGRRPRQWPPATEAATRDAIFATGTDLFTEKIYTQMVSKIY